MPRAPDYRTSGLARGETESGIYQERRLPALAVGTWAGLKLFGKLDDATFRRIVLVLLLISGASLLVLGR